jgi:hypothetical protein
MKAMQRGAEVATRPFSALVAGAAFRRGSQGGRQESALTGPATDAPGVDASAPEPHNGTPHVNGDTNGHAPVLPQPAGNGAALRPAPGDPLRTNGARRPPVPSSSPAGARVGAPDAPDHAHEQSNGKSEAPAGEDERARPARTAGARDTASAGHDAAGELSPRAAHEDVMRRARDLREQQRSAVRDPEPGA